MSSANAVIESAARIHVVRMFSEDVCARLIARAEATSAWDESPGYSNSGEAEARISRSIFERDRPDVFEEVRPEMERAFQRFIGEGASPRFALTRFELLRYEPGGMFPPHRDAGAGDIRRRYSWLVYLNDEFEGGATTFPMLERTLRPHRGQAILFPSTYLHAGGQVTSGRKYALTGYLGDPAAEPDWF